MENIFQIEVMAYKPFLQAALNYMPHGILPGTYSIALVEVQQASSARKCVRQKTWPGYKDIPLYSHTLQRSFFYLF